MAYQFDQCKMYQINVCEWPANQSGLRETRLMLKLYYRDSTQDSSIFSRVPDLGEGITVQENLGLYYGMGLVFSGSLGLILGAF